MYGITKTKQPQCRTCTKIDVEIWKLGDRSLKW
nr:MAG TPA: hypothetical protein [Caudoviricetes sp.]DAL44821.1 MAG TPA_asm: hypothetical protein [Caudoviricetes sp.]